MDLRIINKFYDYSPISDKSLNTKTVYRELIPPIFDRTYEDILALRRLLNSKFERFTEEEKTAFLNADFKGAINASDLNRIETNLETLALGFEIPITVKTDWTNRDIPTFDDFERILTNLTKLRNSYLVYEDTPDIPEHPINAYQKLNDIEKNIYDMYSILSSQIEYFVGDSIQGSVVELYVGNEISLI